MRKPKKFLKADHEILDIPHEKGSEPGDYPVIFFKDHEGYRPDTKDIMNKYSNKPKTHLED